MSRYFLEHYGIPKKSGRYPWGSGENPYHHGKGLNPKAKKALKVTRGIGLGTAVGGIAGSMLAGPVVGGIPAAAMGGLMGGYYEYVRLTAPEVKKNCYYASARDMATMGQVRLSQQQMMDAMDLCNMASRDALSMHMYSVTGMV